MAMSRLVAIVLALAVPGSAAALSILPVSDDRRIEVALVGGPLLAATPPAPFAPFDDFVGFVGAGEAFQTSSVGALDLAGRGGDFTDGAGDTSGFSRYDVTFRVDAPASFALTGEVSGDFAFFTVRLSDPVQVLFEPVLAGGVPVPLDETGLLLPGVDYRLLVESAHPSGQGLVGPNEWDFVFVVTTPEPSAFALLLAGLAALAHARRPGVSTPGAR